MSAAVVPLFKALPGIEALYGGLGSLWHLPLQTSDINDTLFSLYLAKHPLTAKQNATLAKPRPPTMPGFGEPLYLLASLLSSGLAPDLFTTAVDASQQAQLSSFKIAK